MVLDTTTETCKRSSKNLLKEPSLWKGILMSLKHFKTDWRLRIEETLMAQFIDGLHDRIARKVERQTYQDLEELLHLAVQAEQHIKRKTLSASRSKSTWNLKRHHPKI